MPPTDDEPDGRLTPPEPEPAPEPGERSRYRHRRRRRVPPWLTIAIVLLTGVVVAALVIVAPWQSSKSATPVAAGPASSAPPTSAPTSTTTTLPATTVPNGHSTVATAKVPNVDVYAAPDGSMPTQSFQNPWLVNNDPNAKVPLVFLVAAQTDDGWLQVLLPTRPNGSTGWIKADDVDLSTVEYRIEVSLGAHTLKAFKGDQVVLQDKVAVGAPATPTPQGVYFVRALLKAPNPNTVYGPYAYGLSGYSETLQEFDGGDAEVGIHGNNDASVLGKDVTHGCVRMSNDGVTKLAALLPLGTPVQIVA